MASAVKIKRGDGTPVAGADGSNGVWPYELAWDYTNNKLYINDNGTMREVGGGSVSAVANGSDNRIATFSSSTALNGEANLTFDGTTLQVNNRIHMDGASPFLRIEESGETNTPEWWVGADGGNFSIRLNNSGGYPMTINTDSDNDAVDHVAFGYNVSIPQGSRYTWGNSHTYISEDADDRLRFFVGGTEMLRLTESSPDTILLYHNTGIGTTTPDTRLDVTASGVQGVVINQDGSNADISSRLFFKEQNSTIALYNTGDTFSFRTGATIGSTSGTQRFYVNTSGANVVGDLGVSGNTVLQYGLAVNEGGHNADFRAEGDTEPNLFKVDASADKVGINQGSPSFKLDINGDLRVVGSGDHMIRFTRSGADVVSIEQDSSQLYFYNRTTSKVMFLMSETGSAKLGYNSNPDLEIRNTGTSSGNGGSLTFGHSQDSSNTAMARISGYLVDGSSGGRAGHLRFWTSRAGSDELAMQLQNDNKLRLYQPGDTSDYGEMYVDDTRVHFHAASGNYHRFTTDHGYIELGPANDGWGHINTDRGKFYFNYGITVDSGIVTSYDEDLSLRRTTATADRIDITADYTRVIVNDNEEFRVDATGTLTSGQVRTTNEYQVNSSGTTIRRYVDAWSNAQTHDVVYNGYGTNLGDYVYLKASGNGTAGHGMAVVADNVFAVGDSDVETGSITNSLTAPMTDTWLTINDSGNAIFKGSVTANGNKPVLTENGSWFGDLGSNGWTRVFTFDNGGGVMSWALKNGQMSTIIDGSHFAYEAGTNQGGGFYSSSDSSYANATGIVASGGTLYVKQADGTNASLFSTGDIICNSGYISGQGNDLYLRRTTNNDDRMTIEASEIKFHTDAVERLKMGSAGITINRNANPNADTNMAINLSGSYGGGIHFIDTKHSGIWCLGSGTEMHFGVGGSTYAGLSNDQGLFMMEDNGDFHANEDVIAFSSSVGSDKKFKKNIKDTSYGLSDVMKMRAVEYDWIKKRKGKHDIGVIAQEIEKIIPEVVQDVKSIGGSEGTHKVVDYGKLASVLIKAIQEQQVQIDELKIKLGE